jgi:hypothetical protein
MRSTVDYRSALVMAATLGGSALAQDAPARTVAEHYWSGAAELGNRRTVLEPYQRQRSWVRVKEQSADRID